MDDLTVITTERIEEILGEPFQLTAHDCHGTSIALVKSGAPEFKGCRVARGTARAVMGQHSWIVHGDPYDIEVKITDATLWSYDTTIVGVHVQNGWGTRYMPHGGRGTIWDYRPPPAPVSEIMSLDTSNLSREAKVFLDAIGPLDAHGWNWLGDAPVRGWPAGEIYAAAWETPMIGAFIPIDKVGMTTDLNPAGVYL